MSDLDEVAIDTLLGDVDEVLSGIGSGCWGAELSGGQVCTPDFQQGNGHFKNKFCAKCREHGITIAADRVCVLTPWRGKKPQGLR